MPSAVCTRSGARCWCEWSAGHGNWYPYGVGAQCECCVHVQWSCLLVYLSLDREYSKPALRTDSCCVQVAAWLLAAGARCGVATGNQWAPNHLSCVVSHAGGSSKRQRSGIRIRVRQRSVSRSSVVKSRGDKSWQQAMNNIQL